MLGRRGAMLLNLFQNSSSVAQLGSVATLSNGGLVSDIRRIVSRPLDHSVAWPSLKGLSKTFPYAFLMSWMKFI